MFLFTIKNQQFTHNKEWITGREIFQKLGISPKGNQIIQRFRFGRKEVVELGEKVDLAPSGVEQFEIGYKFTINGKKFIHDKEWITGQELLNLLNIPKLDKSQVLQKFRFGRVEKVELNEKVDLAVEGVEKFEISQAHKKVIIVNGRQKEWNKKEISFKELIILAFNQYVENEMICYTVTYTRGCPPKTEGSLVKGETVILNNKMIFNVTSTDKS